MRTRSVAIIISACGSLLACHKGEAPPEAVPIKEEASSETHPGVAKSAAGPEAAPSVAAKDDAAPGVPGEVPSVDADPVSSAQPARAGALDERAPDTGRAQLGASGELTGQARSVSSGAELKLPKVDAAPPKVAIRPPKLDLNALNTKKITKASAAAKAASGVSLGTK